MAPGTALALPRLERALQAIQARPEDNHDLTRLAESIGSSTYHSHRLFKSAFGQTPRRLVEAIRLERAANELVLHDRPIVEIALAVGFNNHETFSRAFKRRFAVTPRAFRARGQLTAREPLRDRRRVSGEVSFELSRVRLQVLRPVVMLGIEKIGLYEEVPERLYEDLVHLAHEHGLEPGRFVGLGLDPPGTEARFHAGLTIAPSPGERHRLERALTRQRRFFIGQLPTGLYAMASHVGHFQSLYHAIVSINSAVAAMDDVDLVGLPVIEIYHSRHVDRDELFNQTDVYIPVRRRPGG